jgi:acetylornithine deacetylase/succinyl-diaminopimelate desuccinylase-like protein
MWGGPVPDPVMALSKVLAKLVDDQGRPAIPGLYKNVKPLTSEQKKMLKNLPYDEKSFRHQAGLLDKVKIVGGDEDVYSKMWHLPSISVNAISAASWPPANIICDVVKAKVGIRIVPNMDPQETLELLTGFLKENTPWGCEVKVTPDPTGRWWSTSAEGPAFEAAKVALKKGYGVDPVFMGSGGSIPFVQPFSEALGGAPALLIGVEDPYTNAHSENESLHVADWEKACLSAIYLYAELALKI